MNYHITLVESAEGVAVWCDDLPGCSSQGSSRKQALANIREAIREWLGARSEVERRFKVKVQRKVVAV